MSTTTIRLDADDAATLDELAAAHGGRSSALKAGLRLLAAETHRRTALAELVSDWELESGPVDAKTLDAVRTRYGL